MSQRGRLASDKLTRALLNLAAAGGRASCSDSAVKDLFLSEFPAERQVAIRLCPSCPVQPECLEAATANRESFGVFGGRDFTRSPNGKATAA